MKKWMTFSLSVLFTPFMAHAYLPTSSLTTMSLLVHGVYMSSDATCTTGLVATVPLSKTAQTINFASSPVIGSGSVPTTIGCVIIVVENNLSTAWSAGTYDSLTSNSKSDSVCDAGGSNTGQTICNNGTPTWPTQITTDAAAIGLTLWTASCTSSATTSVVPLVLSTNSVCTGQSTADASVTACNSNNNTNNFALPTSTSDASNGTKLTAPSVAGNFVFVVNPTNTLGNCTGNSSCGSSGCGNSQAPLFSFRAQ